MKSKALERVIAIERVEITGDGLPEGHQRYNQLSEPHFSRELEMDCVL